MVLVSDIGTTNESKGHSLYCKTRADTATPISVVNIIMAIGQFVFCSLCLYCSATVT